MVDPRECFSGRIVFTRLMREFIKSGPDDMLFYDEIGWKCVSQ